MEQDQTDFPDDAAGQALKRFCELGFNMKRPMEMDFYISIPTMSAGNNIAAEVRIIGFDTDVEQDEETKDYTCTCTKSIIPTYANVTEIEARLDQVAKRYGGYIDGFGSFGNADDINLRL